MMKGHLSLVCAIITLSCLCDTFNHLGLKKAADRIDVEVRGLRSALCFGGKVFRLPVVWLSITFGLISLFLFLYALTMSELSFAFSLDSLHHVFIAIASWVFLKEKMGKLRWTGTLCIILGIVMIAISGAHYE